MRSKKNDDNGSDETGRSGITELQVEEFNANGALLLRQLLPAKWVERIRAGVASSMARPSQYAQHLYQGVEKGAYYHDYFNWRTIPEIADLFHWEPIVEVAGRLMGCKSCIIYHEHVLVKEPGATKRTPWHHDQSYYPVDGSNIVSLWIPVDEVAKESSIVFVQGSHRWDKWFKPRNFETDSSYSCDLTRALDRCYEDVPVSEIESGRWPLLSWPCQPGDVIAFHGKTLHGAPGNSSMTPRRVVSLRFVGDDAVIAERPWKPSPPIWGGLKPGQRLAEAKGFFPTVWTKKD